MGDFNTSNAIDTIRDVRIPPPWFIDASKRVAKSIERADEYIHPLSAEKTWSHAPTHYLIKKSILQADDASYKTLLMESRAKQTLRTLVGNHIFLQVEPNWDKWTTRLVVIHAQDIANIIRRKKATALCLQSACIFWGAPLLCVQPTTSILIERKNRSARRYSQHSHMFPKNTVKTVTYQCCSSDITRIDGIPVTSRLRTLLDVLARFPEPDYIVPGDALLRALVDYDDLRRVYSEDKFEHVRKDFHSLVSEQPSRFPKRKVLQRFSVLHPASESPLESVTRFFLHALGIMGYQLQYPVMYQDLGGYPRPLNREEQRRYHPSSDGPVKTVFVDIAIPMKGFALECDGAAKKLGGYSSVEANEKRLWKKQNEQNQRDAILQWHFTDVVHLDWRRLWNWNSFIYAIRKLFA
ncbi:MAG: hypothetical protein Q4P66_00170 [Actinomycetaceae bacterium]|nr:hypothetical protein [Actinomycetaceae bacterium]